MLPMEKSVTFTGACANEIIPSIKRSFVYKAKKLQGQSSTYTHIFYQSNVFGLQSNSYKNIPYPESIRINKWGKKQKTDKTDTLTQKHDCSVDALCELWRFPMCIERYCRMLRY